MKTIVLSLGGSLIVPDKIDIKFLKNFKKTIEKYIKKDNRFVIYCGGGKVARDYQNAASKIIKLSNNDLDWIGTHVTRLNAHLIKTIFKKDSEEIVVKDPRKKVKFNKKILVAGGWKPGWSTDYDAVLVAKKLKSSLVINMSNVDYVYDRDPKKFKNSKKIKSICWKHFRKFTGNKWKPGLNLPFDPIAAKEAEKSRIKVAIIGNNLKNFENLLNNKDFKGTVIF